MIKLYINFFCIMKKQSLIVSLLISYSQTDAEVIFRDAAALNMTGAGYVWIVTEQALDAPNAPEGLLGLKLINSTDEKAHITDSL